MSESEKQTYLSAVKVLKARSSSSVDMMKPETWNHDTFVSVHWDTRNIAHSLPMFFPWHRLFTFYYEQALRTVDSSITVPYWDWSMDSQRPASSPIFNQQYFGGNGHPSNRCVTDGVAAGWITTVPGPSQRPGPSCLMRCFAWSVLWSPEPITAVLNRATRYDDLRSNIEGGPHGTVHQQGGSPCGDFSTMYSVNDPLFFLHHSMTDKIWWKWQKGCKAFETMYDGQGASKNTYIHPWPVRIQQILSANDDFLCYEYSNSSGDLPLNLNCPTNADNNETRNETIVAAPDLASQLWLETAIKSLIIKSGNSETMQLDNKISSKLSLETEEIELPKYAPKFNLKVLAPSTDDTTDQIHIRHPTPISKEFISRMGLDPYKVRQYEIEAMQVVDDFNNKEGYISPSALSQQST